MSTTEVLPFWISVYGLATVGGVGVLLRVKVADAS